MFYLKEVKLIFCKDNKVRYHLCLTGENSGWRMQHEKNKYCDHAE